MKTFNTMKILHETELKSKAVTVLNNGDKLLLYKITRNGYLKYYRRSHGTQA